MKPFIVIERGGWYHAYKSRWAWWWGCEPILRAKTWAAMSAAVEGLKKPGGLRLGGAPSASSTR